MRAVAIIGGGSTPFGKLEGMGILDLAVSACREGALGVRKEKKDEAPDRCHSGIHGSLPLSGQSALGGSTSHCRGPGRRCQGGILPPREAPVTRATFPSRRPLMRGPDYPLTEPAVRPLT